MAGMFWGLGGCTGHGGAARPRSQREAQRPGLGARLQRSLSKDLWSTEGSWGQLQPRARLRWVAPCSCWLSSGRLGSASAGGAAGEVCQAKPHLQEPLVLLGVSQRHLLGVCVHMEQGREARWRPELLDMNI